MTYDIILAGLGAMGSAAAFQLAGRGVRVLGLDRYHPPHILGSTHGGSRVIRESAFEHPRYVPLARRAYQNWRRLETEAGESLLHVTGVLFVGPPEGALVAGTLASARDHGVHHELLTPEALTRRFPALRRLDEVVGVLEPGGGWLDPERCLAASLRLAGARGVELLFDEPLLRWESDGDGVVVTTPRHRYRAGRLLLALGPWLPELLGPVGVTLAVERQVQHWFVPAPDAVTDIVRLPIFIRQAPEGVFYALPPASGEGEVKVAVHHDGALTTPGTVTRSVSPQEIEATRTLLDCYVPGLAAAHRRAAVCLYTNSADGHFVIDRHPGHPAVMVASPCSGFGFKFASVVGEILADLLTDAGTRFDLEPFQLER
ncbi:MAG: N-methyl-L-tryptophan oxidase [Gemmatimonadales bacterium]